MAPCLVVPAENDICLAVQLSSRPAMCPAAILYHPTFPFPSWLPARFSNKAVNKLTVTLMGKRTYGWGLWGLYSRGGWGAVASGTEDTVFRAIGLDMLGMFCFPVLGGNMCRKFTHTFPQEAQSASCSWPQILNN